MKIIIKRDRVPYMSLLVSVLLFAMTCLYTEENAGKYYIILGILFLLTIIECIKKPYKLNITFSLKYVWWLIILFMIYSATALLRNTYADYSHVYVLTHLFISLMFITWFCDESIDMMLNCICRGATLGSIFSMLFVAVNEIAKATSVFVRIGTSTTGNADVYGMYLGVMSIFTLYSILFCGKKTYIPIYVFQVAFMLMTGSKQTFIYILIPYVAFQLYKNKRQAWKNILPIILVVILIWMVFNVPILYNTVGNRIASMFVSFGFRINGVQASFSQDRRNDLIGTAIRMFPNFPIFGGGWGYFTRFSGFNEYSHCNYTEILVTYGLIVFIYYYYPFFKMLARYIRIHKKQTLDILFITLLVSLLLGDIVRITFYQTALNYCILFMSIKYYKERFSVNEAENFSKNTMAYYALKQEKY